MRNASGVCLRCLFLALACAAALAGCASRWDPPQRSRSHVRVLLRGPATGPKKFLVRWEVAFRSGPFGIFLRDCVYQANYTVNVTRRAGVLRLGALRPGRPIYSGYRRLRHAGPAIWEPMLLDHSGSGPFAAFFPQVESELAPARNVPGVRAAEKKIFRGKVMIRSSKSSAWGDFRYRFSVSALGRVTASFPCAPTWYGPGHVVAMRCTAVGWATPSPRAVLTQPSPRCP